MTNAIQAAALTQPQADGIVEIIEGQFVDVKAKEIGLNGLSKAISAFGNTEGGDLYIGIEKRGLNKDRKWNGFLNPEAANGIIQALERLYPVGVDYLYEFLTSEMQEGYLLHVQVNKTQRILRASNDIAYVRRGAQSLPVTTDVAIKQLEYAKGVGSF